MEAIILAGGLGKRLRSTVPDLPKPMAPIKGKPFLWYLLDYWLHQGINHFILSVGYKFEVIREQFGTKFKNAEVSYAIESKPLGTGGGLLLAIKHLRSKEPFVINSNLMAVEALKIMKSKKISHLIVKKNNKYYGVIHIQNIIKEGII